jgi:hypothetical protein
MERADPNNTAAAITSGNAPWPAASIQGASSGESTNAIHHRSRRRPSRTRRRATSHSAMMVGMATTKLVAQAKSVSGTTQASSAARPAVTWHQGHRPVLPQRTARTRALKAVVFKGGATKAMRVTALCYCSLLAAAASSPLSALSVPPSSVPCLPQPATATITSVATHRRVLGWFDDDVDGVMT